MRKHALGHLAAKRFQQREFRFGWESLGLHPRSHEKAVVAVHAAMPVHAVRPLEVVGQCQGFPDPYVLEQVSAIIDHDAIVHAVGSAHEMGFLLEQALVIAGEIVGGGEGALVLVAVVVEDACPQRLQHDVHVEKVEDRYALEVVVTDAHVEVPAPVVLDPFEYQLVAGVHLGDAIRAVSEGRFEGRGGELSVFPIMLRQRREPGREDHQLRVLLGGLAETKREGPGPGLFQFDDIAVSLSPTVGRVGTYDFECPQDVVHGNRFAVVPIGVFAQRVGHPTVVVRHVHAFRELAVVGSQFVFRRLHERIVERRAEPGVQVDSRHPPFDIDVQIVERADDRHSDRSAFRRIRISVVEVPHVARVLQVAEIREAVAWRRRDSGGGNKHQEAGKNTHCQCRHLVDASLPASRPGNPLPGRSSHRRATTTAGTPSSSCSPGPWEGARTGPSRPGGGRVDTLRE